jgi:hypothetical protein
MALAILLVFTPLVIFVLWDLLTNNSTGTINGLQELATRPGDALMALLIFALVGSLFVVSQVIIIPFFMRGGKTKAEHRKAQGK